MGSEPQLLQVAVASAVGGGGLLYKAIKNHKRLRKIVDTPRSKVASAPQGFIELEGFAWPQGETVQTLDGEEAIFYVLQIQKEEQSGSGKNRRRYWVTVFNYEHVVPFYLLDPTGVAMIIPHNSENEMRESTQRLFSKLSPDARTRVADMANGTISDFPPRTGFFSNQNKFRIIEKKLIVGSPFYATGDFKTHSFNQLTIDDSLATFANKVINFEARSLKNVKALLDRNNDGHICADEANAGYIMAAKLSRLNPKTETVPLEVFGTLDSSDNHQLFFADTHQHHLVERLGRWQTLKLTGGAALVTVSICLGLFELGIIVNPFEAERAAQQARLASEQRSLAAAEVQINALHEACVNGQKGFCQQLLERKSELGLSPEHIRYYEQQSR